MIMNVADFNLDSLYKGLELLLIFWLCALVFKWLLKVIFSKKGAKIIGVFGYVINYSLKKIVLKRVFKTKIINSDPLNQKFEFEETDRWDILFPALFFVPFTVGLIVGSLIGTLGLLLESTLPVLAIICYIVGFLVAINAAPDANDVRNLCQCSIRSIFSWFLIASLLSAVLATGLSFFIGLLGIIIGVLVGMLLSSLAMYYIPPISDWLNDTENTVHQFIGGTIDLD